MAVDQKNRIKVMDSGGYKVVHKGVETFETFKTAEAAYQKLKELLNSK